MIGAAFHHLPAKRKVAHAGDYQSTPHRVINLDRTKSRVSVPFFYEPAFEAVVQPIQQIQGSRCVNTSTHSLSGLAAGAIHVCHVCSIYDVRKCNVQVCTVSARHVWQTLGK